MQMKTSPTAFQKNAWLTTKQINQTKNNSNEYENMLLKRNELE